MEKWLVEDLENKARMEQFDKGRKPTLLKSALVILMCQTLWKLDRSPLINLMGRLT